jgi:hypothetical protein
MISIAGLFGHSAGHSIYIFNFEEIKENKDVVVNKIIVAGDFMHFLEVQATKPKIAIKYDVDPLSAVFSREKFLELVTSPKCESKVLVAGYHLPFPSIVVFSKDEQKEGSYKYDFIPN